MTDHGWCCSMVWQMLGCYVRSLRKETLISFKSNIIITIFIGAHTVWTFGHVPQILDVLACTNKHHIHNSLKSWCRKQNSHRQWYAVICVVMITIKLCCWHLLVVASYGRSTDLWMNEWMNKQNSCAHGFVIVAKSLSSMPLFSVLQRVSPSP